MFGSLNTRLQNTLELDLHGMPRWKAYSIRCFQIFYAALRDLADGQLSLQAMSLVYTTLITLVPLLAISFSVLKGFGVHNQIEPFLLNALEGLGPEKSAEVAGKVIGFVDNIKVGVLGAVGLALLLYAVIALMQKIEAAFNYIWRVGQDRTLAQRFSGYLSVLLMGPLLLFLSAGITASLRLNPFVQTLAESPALTIVYDLGSLFVPWLVMALGFTFFYVYMPNTKVRISPAFIGALVAALLWKVMGYIFTSFIAGSANYVAIYAAFATLIVLMVWLYASWLVVLTGSNIAFYIQYPRYLRISRSSLVLTPYQHLTIGLSVLTLIAQSYYRREEPWTADGLSKKLNIPILAVQKIMGVLEEGGILTTSQNEPCRYYPAVPFGRTPLQQVIDVLEGKNERRWIQLQRMNITPETQSILKAMDEGQQKAITHKTIAQTLIGEDEFQDSKSSAD